MQKFAHNDCYVNLGIIVQGQESEQDIARIAEVHGHEHKIISDKRLCKCGTILSMYNPSVCCFKCQQAKAQGDKCTKQ